MNPLKNTILFALLLTSLLQACAKRGEHMPLTPINKAKLGTPPPSNANPSDDPITPPDNSKNSSTYCEKITISEIGYEEDILPIVEKYCKTCHQSGPKDWTNYESFSTAKEVVFNRVFNTKDMPIAGMPKPNEEELNQLKHWLENGVPQKRGKEAKVIPCPPEIDTTTY